VVEVVAIDGVRVTLRNDRTRRFTAVQISRLAASARPAGGTLPAGDAGVSPGLALGSMASEQLDQVAEQAGHVREVLTGYKSGHPDQARPGEPRPGVPGGATAEGPLPGQGGRTRDHQQDCGAVGGGLPRIR
jgi:hypothetical protein